MQLTTKYIYFRLNLTWLWALHNTFHQNNIYLWSHPYRNPTKQRSKFHSLVWQCPKRKSIVQKEVKASYPLSIVGIKSMSVPVSTMESNCS